MATPHRPDEENPGWVIPPPPGTGPQTGGQAVPGYDPNPQGVAHEPTPAYGAAPPGSGPYAPSPGDPQAGPPPGNPQAGPPPGNPQAGRPPAGPQAEPEPYTAPLDARPYATPSRRRVPKRALIIAGGSVAAALLVGVSAAAVVAANKREHTNAAEDRGGDVPAPAGASSATAGDGTMGTPSPQKTPKAEKSAKPSPSRSGGGGGASRSGRDAPPPIPAGFIKDSSAGLAYPGKGTPWFRGDQFDDYRSSWTSYLKRKVSSDPDYYAEIGAGRLPSSVAYSGSSSLRSATETMAGKYLGDRGLYPEHDLTGVVSAARTVDGRRAWYYSAVLKFPQAAKEGWAWKSERMTLLVVHLPGRRPGTMFTTIPDVLNTSIGASSISAARVL